jgi:hypothetical protein
VFDDFKTSNHHDVVLNWLKENANVLLTQDAGSSFTDPASVFSRVFRPQTISRLPPPGHPATHAPPL